MVIVPEQIVCVAASVTIGKGFTMTESEVLPIQPVEVMVPVMVYTVVIIGFAVTIDPIEALKPEEGDQV